MAAVDRILEQLELQSKPLILVFNKTDQVGSVFLEHYLKKYGGIAISALDRQTIPWLIEAMELEVEAILGKRSFSSSADKWKNALPAEELDESAEESGEGSDFESH
jgi:GTPase